MDFEHNRLKSYVSQECHRQQWSVTRATEDPVILEVKKSTTRTELKRFTGMIKQLGKFTPNIADLS